MDLNLHVHHHESDESLLMLTAMQAQLTQQGKDIKSIMAGITDVNSAETTLHQDLVAENGLILQLLTAFANGNLTSTQAQALVDGMNADDATAKSNVAAITAALPAPAAPTGTAPAA